MAVAIKNVTSTDAREEWSELLDKTQNGNCGALIIRNSREAAALLPPHFAMLLPLVDSILRDLGESLTISEDPEIIAAFERACVDLGREKISWYEV